MKYIVLILFASVVFLYNCEKEEGETNGDPDAPFNYESLETERDTISPGEIVTITAVATGYNLQYHWSASAGDILGSGYQVNYATSPCHAGINEITCEVKDGNNHSETKSISIVVN